MIPFRNIKVPSGWIVWTSTFIILQVCQSWFCTHWMDKKCKNKKICNHECIWTYLEIIPFQPRSQATTTKFLRGWNPIGKGFVWPNQFFTSLPWWPPIRYGRLNKMSDCKKTNKQKTRQFFKNTSSCWCVGLRFDKRTKLSKNACLRSCQKNIPS